MLFRVRQPVRAAPLYGHTGADEEAARARCRLVLGSVETGSVACGRTGLAEEYDGGGCCAEEEARGCTVQPRLLAS